ncbi:S1C family serine protease, partial [Candidatus Latescibacterota bacterium]
QEIRELFNKVNPAVVVIRTLQLKPSISSKEGYISMEGQGSGIMISEDGKIMTAAHVVQIADRIVVEFLDGQEIPANVIASAPYADISLLQLERRPANIKPVKLGDSDKVEIGDRTFIVGAPYGLKHTLTVGYISGRHKSSTVIGNLTPLELIQTDAAINMGNSGGPMFNMKGEVIGIVSHILSQSGGFEGIGFAITSNLGDRLLIQQKSFWTGINSYFITGALAEIFNLPQPAGLLVQDVAAGSPYARLGLRPGFLDMVIENEELTIGGDIILEVGGIPVPSEITDFYEFNSFMNSLKSGDTLSVKIIRAGKILELSTKIE